MDEKDLEEIAAEFALGTLSREEWLEAEARLLTDPLFAEKVTTWEYRLAPLDVKDGDEVPPFGLWHKISNRLNELPSAHVSQALEVDATAPPEETLTVSEADPSGGDNDHTIINLKNSRNRWRNAFVGAVALAASFIGLQAAGIYLPFLPKPPVVKTGAETGKFVAVLNPSGTAPGFLIRIDVKAKRLQIERLAAKAPRGKDYELWLIEPEKDPKAIHVVGRDRVQHVGFSHVRTDKPVTFAISLEPEGGSPTGKVTGDVVFKGQLISQ